MALFLLRHGATLVNQQQLFQGQLDTALSEEGMRQTQRLALYLREMPIRFILSSPLQRAAQMAEIIGTTRANPIPPIFQNELKERDVGRLAGLSKQHIQEQFPELEFEKGQYSLDFRFPGGESNADFFQRCQIAFSIIRHYWKQLKTGEHICAVSHGGTINALITIALGFPYDGYTSFKIDTAAFAILEFRFNRYYLQAFNCAVTL